MTSAEHVENNYGVRKSCSYLEYVRLNRPLYLFLYFSGLLNRDKCIKIIKMRYTHTQLRRYYKFFVKFFEMQIYSDKRSIQLNH